MTDLTLSEQMLLLVLHDERGNKVVEYAETVTAAAAIAEMVLGGMLVPSPDKKDRYSWGSNTTSDDAFLAEVRNAIDQKGVSKKVKNLIPAIAKTKRIFDPLYDRLVDRGILRREQKSFLFFKWSRFPEKDPTAERALKARLEQVMFQNQEPTPGEAAIIALSDAVGALSKNFDKGLLKEHKDRIKAIAKGEGVVSDAVKSVISDMTAIIVAAVIVPTIVT